MPSASASRTGPLPTDRFLNRELSWLDFNARVLELAENDSLPLLERMKFLAIFAGNLDEFFMVRIAGLKRRHDMGLTVRSPDGLTIREQLELITRRTQDLVQRHADVFLKDVAPRLEDEGIRIVHYEDLEDDAARRLREYFRDQVFPVLTPLAVDPGHPFPYISGLSLNLAVSVRDPDSGVAHFARVKVPNNVPRFVPVGPTGQTATFLPLEDLIAVHLPQLFPGLEVLSHHLFRVTRNADMEVEEDRDEDLLQALERELSRRRFGPAVRLEVTDTMDPQILEVLLSEMEMRPEDVLHVPGLLDLSALWSVYDLDRPELKDDPFVPATHPRLSDGETPKSVFATLREGDVLVHHPYYSFATSVQRFIEQAAADPQVLAIKQTLYRTSGDSPIVNALIDAAEAGKQVVVLVEIKARFDEEANITWARSLERAGCHVVYGLVGLKTHCKTALVVRREHGVLRRYCHIGTGNYNPKTARIYEDLGILTADPRVGADLTDLFNTLTGYSRQTNYRTLMVAPHGIRVGLIEKIRREARHAAEGKPSGIRIKANSLVDEKVIDALYEASQAGVTVELLLRGICSLRPGVPGMSESIRVRSIVGRFLEHSRVMSFANDGEPEWWLGSADLMHRNLDRRVEVLLRVCDETARTELQGIFEAAMAPDVRCWELGSDGSWAPTGERDYQADLLRRAGEHAG
ncbi:RNA degradosome polyphosphate kinase [Blastococcus sp. CT_GayMR19]|uniref:RNA degradosome polyphosphate kinase n=1 Tax=Blastococcus sp. CT_GayMR19 TaxID=2559608 RepID=UPI001FD80FF3|nr:RNA degradosome polyphosphate kinase [Blastococcus sp. CT_GayMR19]